GHGERQGGSPIQVNIHGRTAMAAQFGFGGGFPFQQALARYHAPHQRPNDGVQREQRLVRQESKVQEQAYILRNETGERIARRFHPLVLQRPHQVQCAFQPGGEEQDGEGGHGPVRRAPRQQQPAQQQKQEGGRLHQAAAEIIQNFPARDQGNGIENAGAAL